MFQRKNNSLPTTTPLGVPSGNTGGFGLQLGKSGPDGSGKAIKMDAPVVKAWKQSSAYTKYSYYILLFFIFLMFVGYRHLRYWNGECRECRVLFLLAQFCFAWRAFWMIHSV
jgi:hypothetical protein